MDAVDTALDMAEIMAAKKDIPAFLSWIDQASVVSDQWIPTRHVIDRWQRNVNVFRDFGAVATAVRTLPHPNR